MGTITVQAISPAAITLSPTTPAATILPGNSVTIPVTVSTTLVNVETPILNVTGFPIGISFTSSAVYVYPGNPATSTVTAQVSAGVAPGVYNGTLTVTLCSVFNCQSVFNSQAVPLTISVVAPGSNSIAAFSLPPQGQSCKSTGYYIYTDGVPRTYCYQINYGSSQDLDSCSLSDPSINVYFTPYTGNNFAITYAASTTTAHGSPTLSCEWSGAPTYIAPNAATISVYDATPAVTGMSINPNSPVAPTQFTVVLSGVGFGSTASANTPTLSISPAASYTITAHSPTSVTASITPSGGGNYSIQLVSLGNGNGGFSSGGNPASSNTSNTVTFAVYDPTPSIQAVQLQDYDTGQFISSLEQGQMAYAGVYGYNFGPTPGSAAVCVDGAFPCSSSDIGVQVVYWAPAPVAGVWQVNLILTSAPTSLGAYDIQLTTDGLRGLGFFQAPQGQTGAQSNPRGTFTVVNCADTSDPGNIRGIMISEYYASTKITYHPTCSVFTQVSPTSNVSFATLNSTRLSPYTSQYVQYPWAILTSYMGSGIDGIVANEPYPVMIASGYRNAGYQISLNPASPNGRHIHGDAVDIATYSNDTQWQEMHDAAKQYGTPGGTPCIEPLSESTNNHLHVDWRPSGCASTWLQ